MNIVLKSAVTDQYVTRDGWTPNLAQAFGFTTSARAAAHCDVEKLRDMECIYSFSDASHNITIPISDMQN